MANVSAAAAAAEAEVTAKPLVLHMGAVYIRLLMDVSAMNCVVNMEIAVLMHVMHVVLDV